MRIAFEAAAGAPLAFAAAVHRATGQTLASVRAALRDQAPVWTARLHDNDHEDQVAIAEAVIAAAEASGVALATVELDDDGVEIARGDLQLWRTTLARWDEIGRAIRREDALRAGKDPDDE